jgi:hypothetical protein
MKIKFLLNHPFAEKKMSTLFMCKATSSFNSYGTHYHYPAASLLEKQDYWPKREELKLISQVGSPRATIPERHSPALFEPIPCRGRNPNMSYSVQDLRLQFIRF